MGPPLDDFSVPDSQDHIRPDDGREPVGDHKGGPAPDHGGDGILDGPLRHRIHRGGRLVQNQDPGIGQDGPRDGQKLLLPGGEHAAALADIAVQAPVHPVDHKVRRSQAQGLPDLVVGCIRPAVAEVVPHGPGKQVGGLQDIADAAVEPELGPVPGVFSVDQDPAPGRLVEAAGQVDQGGLARAGLADDGHIGALRHLQIKVVQDQLIPVRVHKGHILEFHFSQDRLPVFPFGMEMVPVFLHDLRPVLHIRLLGQKAREALDIDLDRDQGRQGGDDLLDGLQHAHRIGHEGRQGPDPDDALHGQGPAPPQDQGQGHRRQEGDRRGQDRAVADRADSRAPHVLGLLLEAADHHILDPQGLDAADPGDPLVEVPRDPGIDLPDLPAAPDDLFLKIQDQDRGQGDHDQDIEGQPGVDGQHDPGHPDDIGHIPDHIHHAPGQQLPDPLRVAHGPGVDIAHAVLIEIGKGQGLQVGEGGVAQVPVDRHLDPAALIEAVIIVQLLQNHEQEVEKQEDRQALQGPLRHKVVQGPAVEEREGRIRQTGQDPQKDHPQNSRYIRAHKGKDQRDPEKGRSFSVTFFLHSKSPVRCCSQPPASSCFCSFSFSQAGSSAPVSEGLRHSAVFISRPAEPSSSRGVTAPRSAGRRPCCRARRQPEAPHGSRARRCGRRRGQRSHPRA